MSYPLLDSKQATPRESVTVPLIKSELIYTLIFYLGNSFITK